MDTTLTPPAPPRQLCLLLGGPDLEMATIAQLARSAGARVHDRRPRWGARASLYLAEIRHALATGHTPVAVELANDLPPPLHADPRIIWVDHHGPRAGAQAPTSLHQVFALLALPPHTWTREHQLIAANDSGYIPALRKLGASPQEIARIRAADRAAQGITPEQESAAQPAIDHARHYAQGRLTVIHLPHTRSAVVTDRLEATGQNPPHLLILAPGEINYFGPWATIEALDRRYPGGWSGGARPHYGYWGHTEPAPAPLTTWLIHHLQAEPP